MINIAKRNFSSVFVLAILLGSPAINAAYYPS